MYYKGYEISWSVNAGVVSVLARNSAGKVIFRETTEENIKKAIDASIELRKKNAEAAAKVTAKRKAERHKKGLFAPPPESTTEEGLSTEVSELKTVNSPTSRVVRGPDGKFISKGTLEKQGQEDNKTSFWDRIR